LVGRGPGCPGCRGAGSPAARTRRFLPRPIAGQSSACEQALRRQDGRDGSEVKTSTRDDGDAATICGSAAIPDRIGRSASRTTTSGRRSRLSSTASWPSALSPTTPCPARSNRSLLSSRRSASPRSGSSHRVPNSPLGGRADHTGTRGVSAWWLTPRGGSELRDVSRRATRPTVSLPRRPRVRPPPAPGSRARDGAAGRE
jgi:hypothetical protein